MNVTGLKANTPYNITLYGVINGYRTKPLSVETATGIFSSSLMAPFLCRQGHEPEQLQLLDKACSLGLLCMGRAELIKAWLNISGMEMSHDQTFQYESQRPHGAIRFQECSFYPPQNGLFCSFYLLLCWLTLTAKPNWLLYMLRKAQVAL